MSKVTATPTGCPGPIPGTKVWRCDGVDCCYGPNNYASCKDEIAKRGYKLRLTNDIVQDMLMDKELTKACVQGKLEDTQKLLDKTIAENASKQAMMIAEQDYIANKYTAELIANAVNQHKHDKECSEMSEKMMQLSQELIKTRDELSCYKRLHSEVQNVEAGTGDADSSIDDYSYMLNSATIDEVTNENYASMDTIVADSTDAWSDISDTVSETEVKTDGD